MQDSLFLCVKQKTRVQHIPLNACQKYSITYFHGATCSITNGYPVFQLWTKAYVSKKTVVHALSMHLY